MADSKITALTAISTVDPTADPLVIVDVSDTSMAASGTTKKSTINQLLGAGGTATLASATITGDLTVDTSTLKVDSANNRVGIGTASPAYLLDIADASFATRFVATNTNNSAFGAGVYLKTLNGASMVSNATLATSNDGTFNLLTGTSADSTKLSIGPTGIFTFQNVGGVAGTAMTLNSTGLGVGVTPSSLAGFGSTFRQKGVGAAGGIFTENNTGASWFGIYSGTSLVDSAALIYPSGGTLRFATTTSVGVGGFATQMTLDASGRLLVGPTSANTSGGVLQLSSGITFPATQVASSDANTLDDYEEGSFTPTPNSGTFSAASAKYTKIGNMVTVFFDLTVGTGGGSQITNLPFTAASTSTVASGIYTNNQTYVAGTTAPVVVVGGSGTVMYFRTVGTGVAFSAMSFTAGANLTGSISYFV